MFFYTTYNLASLQALWKYTNVFGSHWLKSENLFLHLMPHCNYSSSGFKISKTKLTLLITQIKYWPVKKCCFFHFSSNNHFATSSLQNSKTFLIMLNIEDGAKCHNIGPRTKSPVSVSWFPVPQHVQRPVPKMSKRLCVVNSTVADTFWMWWFIYLFFLAVSWLDFEIGKYTRLSLSLVDGKHSDSHPSLCTLIQKLLLQKRALS